MAVITRAERIAAHRARGNYLKRRLLLLAHLHQGFRSLTQIDPGVQSAKQIDFGRHRRAIPHDTVAGMVHTGRHIEADELIDAILKYQDGLTWVR